jgi:uncharacterized protein YaeQ
MAAGAHVHHVEMVVSDVDRGVYETLDLRVARHPSESIRFLATRLLAFALSYEEGIAFSKGGLSSSDEPPLSVRDATGVLRAWIDVGAPVVERLHKAAKAAERVALYTCADTSYLRGARIHRIEEIEVWRLDAPFIDALGERLDRRTSLEIVRNEGRLYVTTRAGQLEAAVVREVLGA